CPAAADGRARDLAVLSQRGANGIDGMISAAAGAASIRPERGSPSPVVAVIGDVSFAHDASALATAARTRGSLVIVVIDNAGGRIFELLPVARARYGTDPELFDRHWLTRPTGDIARLASAYGCAYVRVAAPQRLTAAVYDSATCPGCTVVHAMVDPSSAAHDRERIISELRAAAESGAASVEEGR
ncbi:MAG: thiamine pyrophosphate-dependent enzyme, partial [Myxococcota bacterium]